MNRLDGCLPRTNTTNAQLPSKFLERIATPLLESLKTFLERTVTLLLQSLKTPSIFNKTLS